MAIAALLGAGLLLAWPLHPQTGPAMHGPPAPTGTAARSTAQAASEYLEAYLAGDAAAMAAATEPADVDAFQVAWALLVEHAAVGPWPAPPCLEAAAALAQRLAARPLWTRLPELVAGWQQATPQELERVRAGAELFEAVRAERRAGRQGAARDLVAARLRADAPLPGIIEVLLCREAAAACLSLGLGSETASFYRRAAQTAESLGWTQEHARCLGKVTRVNLDAGEGAAARELAAQSLPLLRTLVQALDLPVDLVDLGMLQRGLGQSQDAVLALERALTRLQQRPDPALQFQALDGLAATHWDRGEVEASRRRAEQAHAEANAAGDPSNIAVAATHLALFFVNGGEHERALQLYGEALALQRQLGQRRWVAITLADIAYVHSLRLDKEQAAECLRQALSEFRAIGDRLGVADALVELGKIQIETGDLEPATAMFEEALAVQLELGDERGVVATHRAMGGLYTLLARPHQARHYLQLARDAAQRLQYWQELTEAERCLGELCRRTGRGKQALVHMTNALAGFERLGARTGVAAMLRLIGDEHRNQKQLPAAIEFAERAARMHRELQLPMLEVEDLALLARARVENGEFDLALAAAQQALASAPAGDDRLVEWFAHTCTGYVLTMRGDHQQALSHFEPALSALLATGRYVDFIATLQMDLSYAYLGLGRAEDALRQAREALVGLRARATAQSEWADLGEIRRAAQMGLDAAARLLERPGAHADDVLADAFWFVESSRGQLLRQELGNRAAVRSQPVAAELLAERQRAEAQVREGLRRRFELAGTDAAATALPAAETALDRAYTALIDVRARIERQARAAVVTERPEPLQLAAFAATLPRDTAWISYLLQEKQSFALVVRRDRTALVRLVEADAITEKADSWLGYLAIDDANDQALTAGDERRLAGQLHELLLAPLAGQLDGVARLQVCPDEQISCLPFEALLVNGPGGVRTLERFDIAYASSASVQAALAEAATGRARGRGLLAIADPSPPLPAAVAAAAGAAAEVPAAVARAVDEWHDLPSSRTEAQSIAALFPAGDARLLLGPDAAVAEIRRVLAAAPERLAVVHFACHGHLDLERHQLTGLLLSRGEVLSLGDIHDATIDADLAVLSACETARGQFVQGEGVLGLVRGFFVAGSPRVVVSDWKVSDRSTCDFMIDFHRRLRQQVAPAAALRAAKLQQLRAGVHPHHWAAFVLWGLRD